jgi:diacylglycerol kinase family enzyme
MTFVVACGLGLDARVMAGATPELKRRLGFMAYVVAAMQEAGRLRPVAFRIEADGELYEVGGLVVLIANCGQLIPGLVGPRLPIDPTDGLLDVFVVLGTGVPSGLRGAAQSVLAAGPPPHRGSRALRFHARSVRVTSTPPEPVQIDGDAEQAAWLEATILPGALTVLRP